MSQRQQKNNEGVLFKNSKRDRDTSPHARGSATIGGVEYWVSAWTNKRRDSDDKYQSLKFTPKNDKQSQGYQPTPNNEPVHQDDIPF